MPDDAGRAGTPAGVFGAELRFYRRRVAEKQLQRRQRRSLRRGRHDRPGRDDPDAGTGRPAACFRPRYMDGICRTGEGERLNLVRAFPPWP